MMKQYLLSAPEEKYLEHIKRCKEKFGLVFPIFEHSIRRVLNFKQTNKIKDVFYKMIIFHDLGKLTKRWQENVGTNKGLPAHSSVGAVYLWKILPDGLKEPISFAVTIHHSDRGFLEDNIESPDVQAITDRIADFSGKIIFDERVKELEDEYFPNNLTLNIIDLKNMARGLRIWARGCSIFEQHKKRIQASLAHHILKLCDISAATERRKEYKKQDDQQDYYGGWLMVENIKSYVENMSIRNRTIKLKDELIRWEDILKKKYNPEKIILFGSYANGKIEEWSDVDMIILKETDKSFLDRTKEVLLLLQPKVGVDIFVYTPQEFKKLCETKLFFKEEVSSKGVVIYER